jgi:hypothetical protein
MRCFLQVKCFPNKIFLEIIFFKHIFKVVKSVY